jgi:hypothetical protein
MHARRETADREHRRPFRQARPRAPDQLMTRYFAEAKFSEANRPLFAFASYNAGAEKARQRVAPASN